jgi:hypothetical protein
VGAVYYGEGKSVALYLDGKLLNPYEIEVANLSGADGAWANMPIGGSLFRAAIDPELGRIALPPAAAGGTLPKVTVSYYYGFNADLGGGEYAHSDSFLVTDEAFVFPFPDPANYPDLQSAIDFAIGKLTLNGAVAVEIDTSETYPQTGSLDLTIDVPSGCTVELRAADVKRPTLLLHNEISITGDASSTCALNGLLIAASATMVPASPTPVALIHVPAQRPDGSANQLETLNLAHCTLVPGWSVDTQGQPRFGTEPALVVEPPGVNVNAQRSILGAVRTTEFVIVSLSDSIVDATNPTNVAYAALDSAGAAGNLTLTGCTVVGKVHATLLQLVSDSVFWAGLLPGDTWKTALISDRKQEGCVRFSFLPAGAKTPRRFECIEQTIAGPQPIFFALRYGRPGYMKLLTSTPDVVRRGADDGGEMGAFHFVLGPLRESDLRVRMQEYLPVGLEFGIIYQN